MTLGRPVRLVDADHQLGTEKLDHRLELGDGRLGRQGRRAGSQLPGREGADVVGEGGGQDDGHEVVLAHAQLLHGAGHAVCGAVEFATSVGAAAHSDRRVVRVVPG
jgi:hypothetical protein